MIDEGQWEKARKPEDLSRCFVERANTGDVEGLVALYEPEAVLVIPTGQAATGSEAVRAASSGRETAGHLVTAIPAFGVSAGSGAPTRAC